MDARKLGKTGNLHVTNTVARILPNNDLGKALDALVVDDLPQADPGSLGLREHLPVLSFHNSGSNGQS